MNSGHVLVVGGTGGLGPSVVEALAGAGYRVTFTGRDRDRVARVRALVPSAEGRILDAADAGGVATAIAEIDASAPIVAYVHVAGGWAGGTGIESLTPADWTAMLDVNFTSLRNGAGAVFARMRSRGEGSIVTIGSLAAFAGGEGSAPYAVSKAAVVAFTRCLAEEGKGRGVRANCIVPGTIDTPDNRAAMPSADYSRWIPPERIARTIVYLCGPDSSSISGSTILMKGAA
jgi:NAD(P)-dependent dehydrogenase (short-subunit alcohol dehydrogenase family)